MIPIVLNFLHILSLVIWIGMIFFTTFFCAPSIFKTLPRESAGQVMGSIFPKYWLIGYVSSLTALLTLYLSVRPASSYGLSRLALLALMSLLSFVSGLVVGRRARDIKVLMKNAGEGKEKARLKKRFGAVHAISAILNLIILLLGLIVLLLLSIDISA